MKEEIYALDEIASIVYTSVIKLRELKNASAEKYLEYAPAVYKMLTHYYDSGVLDEVILRREVEEEKAAEAAKASAADEK